MSNYATAILTFKENYKDLKKSFGEIIDQWLNSKYTIKISYFNQMRWKMHHWWNIPTILKFRVTLLFLLLSCLQDKKTNGIFLQQYQFNLC